MTVTPINANLARTRTEQSHQGGEVELSFQYLGTDVVHRAPEPARSTLATIGEKVVRKQTLEQSGCGRELLFGVPSCER